MSMKLLKMENQGLKSEVIGLREQCKKSLTEVITLKEELVSAKEEILILKER